MAGGERRRYRRIKKSMKVLVKERQGASQLLTADVSRKGSFIVTDSPWPDRELVHLFFQLPGDDDPIELMGMVTRRTPRADSDDRPGMGIDFFALSAEARKRWDAFIMSLPDEDDDNDGSVPRPVRRRHPRHFSRFLVRLRDKQRLRDFYTRDISGGGMFLRTPTPEQVSPRVELVLVHPQSGDEFDLPGEVVRVVTGPSLADRGVGIQFDPLAVEKEASLLTFIETGVNHLRRVDGSPQERLALILRAVEAMSDSAESLVRLGELLLREVEPESAQKAFLHALELEPTSIGAHRGMYKACTMTDDTERARRYLDAIRRMGLE